MLALIFVAVATLAMVGGIAIIWRVFARTRERFHDRRPGSPRVPGKPA